MRAVKVRHVEEPNPLVQAVPNQALKFLSAQAGVVRCPAAAVKARSLGQARNFDPGFPQGHDIATLVGCLHRPRREKWNACREGPSPKGGVSQEFTSRASIHNVCRI